MPKELQPALDLLVTTVAVMAVILLIKHASSYLPNSGMGGATKTLINAV